MTEKQLLDYAISNGCYIYETTSRYYKVRKIGTSGCKYMSGIEKISDTRELDNTYVYNVCHSLSIPQPINDQYSKNIFKSFYEYWKRFIRKSYN